VVYHPDPSFFMEEAKQQELIATLEMADDQMIKQYVLKYRYNPKNVNWFLVGVASLDGLVRMQKDMVLGLWLLGAMMIVLIISSSGLFAKAITNPVNKLLSAMARVESGELDTHVSVSGSAEIESLSKNFQGMLIQVKGLMEDVRNKEKALRKLRNDCSVLFEYM